MKRMISSLTVIAALCVAASARADDLHVPAQFATIQAAIDAANNGDHVIIAPGVYSGIGNNTIDTLGKAIVVRGTDPHDPAVVAATIIDGQHADVRAFEVTSGETLATTIAGLTIRNMGSLKASTISDGSAVRARFFSTPTIEDCVIEGCSSTALRVSANSGMTLRRCTIASNTSAPTNSAAAGLFVDYNGDVTIEDCEFFNNVGGAICAGGGAHIRMTDSRFADNSASAGAGVRFFGAFELNIDRCTFHDNHATQNGGAVSFAPYFDMTTGAIRNSVFAHNQADGDGGAIYIGGALDSSAAVVNCTIADNTAGGSGGGVATLAEVANLAHSILWNNAAEDGNNLFIGTGGSAFVSVPGSVEISHAVLPTGAGSIAQSANTLLSFGSSVFDVDPHFADASNNDYHLTPASQLIDAGDRAFAPQPDERDIDGEMRVLGQRIDIGADEVDPSLITCTGDIVASATFTPPGDGLIDGADLAFLLGAWGPNPGSAADLVSSATFAPPADGFVDGADLAFMLGSWGRCN